MIESTLELKEKNVYGKLHLYPNCEMSVRLCVLAGWKTITLNKLDELRLMGFSINITGVNPRMLPPLVSTVKPKEGNNNV